MNSHMFHGTRFLQLSEKRANRLHCGSVICVTEFIEVWHFLTIESFHIIKI